MNVIVCGNINTDIIMEVSGFPGFHEKVIADSYYSGQGGAGANTCWWLAKLGSTVSMLGCIGDDGQGKGALRSLANAGADTSRVALCDKATGTAVVISSGQDKRMVKHPGANDALSVDAASLEGAGHIHMTSVSRDNADVICEYARANSVTLSWDPSEKMYPDLVGQAGYLFVNEDDYKRHKGMLERARPAHIIKTLNGGGCVIDESIRIPSLGRTARDTTGAGDAFAAGFVYSVVCGRELDECGVCGMVCAAANIRALGSREGFDTKDEIKKEVEAALRGLRASSR